MTITALAPYLLYIKSFHLIAVIAWMAGLFYLPRLYVYHCALVRGSAESERFKIMEYRLMKQIMNPAMLFSWLFGILLILSPGAVDFHSVWWPVKFVAVILMSGFHGACSKWRKNFLEDRNTKSHRFYRYANEVPTVLMVIIVIMAIAQPF